jgi:hypothetical protein
MEFQKLLLFWVCCQSLVLAEELNEGTEDPSTNYVFNLPDIVANYKTLGEEVQLEAFGASGVNIYVFFYKSCNSNYCFGYSIKCSKC